MSNKIGTPSIDYASIVGIVRKQGGVKLAALIKEAAKADIILTKGDLFVETPGTPIRMVDEVADSLTFMAYAKVDSEQHRYFVVPADTVFFGPNEGTDEDDEDDEDVTIDEGTDDREIQLPTGTELATRCLETFFLVDDKGGIQRYDDAIAAIGNKANLAAAGVPSQIWGGIPVDLSIQAVVSARASDLLDPMGEEPLVIDSGASASASDEQDDEDDEDGEQN